MTMPYTPPVQPTPQWQQPPPLPPQVAKHHSQSTAVAVAACVIGGVGLVGGLLPSYYTGTAQFSLTVLGTDSAGSFSYGLTAMRGGLSVVAVLGLLAAAALLAIGGFTKSRHMALPEAAIGAAAVGVIFCVASRFVFPITAQTFEYNFDPSRFIDLSGFGLDPSQYSMAMTVNQLTDSAYGQGFWTCLACAILVLAAAVVGTMFALAARNDPVLPPVPRMPPPPRIAYAMVPVAYPPAPMFYPPRPAPPTAQPPIAPQ